MSSHTLIDELHAQGLISHDQALRIKDYLNQRQSSTWSLSLIVSVFGGLFIGAGILLWISLHWSSIPDGIKTIMIGLITIGCFVAAWWRHMRVQDGLTAGLRIVACCAFGGSIFLQGQIYNLGESFYDAFGLRFLGVAPLAVVVKMRSLLFASLTLLFVRYVAWLGHFDVIRSVWHVVGMVAGYAMLLASIKPLLLRWFPDSDGLIHHTIVALFSMCLSIFMSQAAYTSTSWFYVNTYWWYILLFPLLACLISLLCFFYLGSGVLRSVRNWGPFILLGVLVCAGLSFGIWSGSYRLGLVIVFVYLVLMLGYVHLTHDNVVRGRTFVLLWILCMTIYIDHFSNAGVLSLIGGGCIALGLGRILQRLNKKMIISNNRS